MNVIYKPKGSAAEYAKYAVNFYTGCSNQCSYCYNRKGLVRNRLGGDEPTLCKKFKSEGDALYLLLDDLCNNQDELISGGGIFFSFTTDPFMKETRELTYDAMSDCFSLSIPVTILTKTTTYVPELINYIHKCDKYNPEVNVRDLIRFGFTLTCSGEMEKFASPHQERINALRILHEEHINTWVSLEPVISIEKAKQAFIDAINAGCRDFKIGLLTGEKKSYTPAQVIDFYYYVYSYFDKYAPDAKIYWKKSVRKYIGME